MKLTTFCIPESLLEALDGLVERGMYPHRAEAIRVAVRDLVREGVAYQKQNSQKNPLKTLRWLCVRTKREKKRLLNDVFS